MLAASRSPRLRCRRPLVLGAALLLAALPFARAARSDTVVVKGTALEGEVVAVTSEKLELETAYGEGTVSIPLADVERLETERAFHVFHGDADRASVGRLLGVEGGRLLVGESRESAEAIELASIHIVRGGMDGGLVDRLRLAFPYWTASYDLNFSYQQATVDSLALGTGLLFERKRKPTRFSAGATYRRGTEKEEGQKRDTLVNELRGITRGEYDLTERLFAFAAGELEYDEVERLDLRAVPKLGLGYVLYEGENARVIVDGGGAWVYENYFGGESDDYFSAALGGGADVDLPWGAKWRTRLDYLPNVAHWGSDYLLRGETGIVFPMTEYLGLKASVVDSYDRTPAPGTDRNSLITLLGVNLAL